MSSLGIETVNGLPTHVAFLQVHGDQGEAGTPLCVKRHTAAGSPKAQGFYRSWKPCRPS